VRRFLPGSPTAKRWRTPDVSGVAGHRRTPMRGWAAAGAVSAVVVAVSSFSLARKQVAGRLIAAYEQIITRAHAQGIRVYGATLTPFGGNTMYDDENGYREEARQTVNRWIRTSRRFDAVIDFDRAARDPADPRRLRPAHDTGDHLHLKPAGYGSLADAVPAKLFQHPRPSTSGFR